MVKRDADFISYALVALSIIFGVISVSFSLHPLVIILISLGLMIASQKHCEAYSVSVSWDLTLAQFRAKIDDAIKEIGCQNKLKAALRELHEMTKER